VAASRDEVATGCTGAPRIVSGPLHHADVILDGEPAVLSGPQSLWTAGANRGQERSCRASARVDNCTSEGFAIEGDTSLPATRVPAVVP